MNSMKQIDESLRKTEVSQRRKYLIMNLGRLGVFESRDGRKLEMLGLAELEWMYVVAKNDELREEIACEKETNIMREKYYSRE